MRLLLLSSEFLPGPGGIGTHAYEVARHMSRLGWEVTVITPQDYASVDEIAAFNHQQPFRIIRLRSLWLPPLKAAYRWHVATKLIKDWKPDRMIASGDRAIWMGALLAERHQLPWVAVGHGTEFGIKTRWQQRLIRWSFERASAIVCVSRYTWRKMVSSGIRPQAGEVIPNGADVARFGPLPEQEVAAFRKELGLGDSNILLTVGNITERKGQEVVIRSLPLILERAPNTCYLMAGLPGQKKRLMAIAKRLKVSGHVRFLGRVSDGELTRLLNACDIFVMTSRHTADGDFEGYGIAVVEAALCGKPAVVSSESGLAEAIAEGETGFGVPENSETATAEKILQLLLYKEQRLSMGKAARERALKEQTWEHRIKEYDALLRRLRSGRELAPLNRVCEDANGIEL